MAGRLQPGTFRADAIQGDPTEYLRTADTSGAPTILVLPGSQAQRGGGGGVAGAQGVVLYHDSAGDSNWWAQLTEACQAGAMIEATFNIKS
jgi:hypothetical protein